MYIHTYIHIHEAFSIWVLPNLKYWSDLDAKRRYSILYYPILSYPMLYYTLLYYTTIPLYDYIDLDAKRRIL